MGITLQLCYFGIFWHNDHANPAGQLVGWLGGYGEHK